MTVVSLIKTFRLQDSQCRNASWNSLQGLDGFLQSCTEQIDAVDRDEPVSRLQPTIQLCYATRNQATNDDHLFTRIRQVLQQSLAGESAAARARNKKATFNTRINKHSVTSVAARIGSLIMPINDHFFRRAIFTCKVG